jgi:hypothetical protein
MMKMPRIPALTAAGGIIKPSDKVLEFRVWVHPLRGSNYYYRFGNLVSAMKYSMSGKGRELPIAVVDNKYWKKGMDKYLKYREVGIPTELLRKIV